MKGQVVALSRDSAAAEGQDDAVSCSRCGDTRRLEVAEHVLAVLREDRRDRFACRLFDGAVQFDDFSAGLLREEFRNGRLAAAGHADEDEVRGGSGESGGQVFDDAVIDVRVEEEFMGADRLRDQHPEAVGMGNAECFRLQQKTGAKRIVDDIDDPGEVIETGQVRHRRQVVGVHADRCRVDDDVGVCVVREFVVGDERCIAPASADDQDLTGPFPAQGLEDRFAGAAAAEDQDFFAVDVDAVRVQQIQEPEDVGVLGDEPAVSAVQGVRRADGFDRRRQFVREGEDRLLVRDRHIEPADVLLFHKGFELLYRQFIEPVGFIAQRVVQER